MAEEHAGFANAVNAKGETVDPREVEAFNDESEAGKIRTASQTTKSSIVEFKTDGKGTNGAPAAVVASAAPVVEPDEADTSDAKVAEGEGANEE